MHTSFSAVPQPQTRAPLPAALLDGLLETAGDAVFRITSGGQIRAASTRAQRLSGVEPGRTLVSLVHEVDQPALRNVLVSAAGKLSPADAAPAVVEARFRLGERDVWYELRVALLDTGDDAPIIVIGRDMSAQHATEERGTTAGRLETALRLRPGGGCTVADRLRGRRRPRHRGLVLADVGDEIDGDGA